MGKDIEYWAGNFGTRFRNESLTLVHEGINRPERQIHAEQGKICPLNYSCDFNFGHGDAYYLAGNKVFNHKWANLNEFDFSLGSRRPE